MAPLTTAEKDTLLELARAGIAEQFGGPRAPASDAAWLSERRSVFVTLHEAGDLRGCVGQLDARYPLQEAVREAARGAAFRDSRFPPVQADELVALEIEISVLSALEVVEARTESELLASLRPGVDGLVLTCGARSGVFIPEMWKQLPNPRDFLYHLRRKAGLPTDRWPSGTRAERFSAELIEAHPRGRR